jgi:hypothetical protein
LTDRVSSTLVKDLLQQAANFLRNCFLIEMGEQIVNPTKLEHIANTPID